MLPWLPRLNVVRAGDRVRSNFTHAIRSLELAVA
jgi:hypothetical protein